MPLAPIRKASWLAWPFATVMMAGLGYWVYQQPYVLIFLAGIAVLVWIQTVSETRQRRRLAASRQGESICDFARSFDRSTDTWILRAVYEELGRFISVDRRPLPVRREDRCENDLKIDPEDLDDLARNIAFRAGRSMKASDKNPLYDKVKTVSDFVAFLEHQPRAQSSNNGLHWTAR